MANWGRTIKAALAVFDLRDATVLVGLVLIAVGCWPWFRPASFIVPGIVLVWYGLPARPSFFEKKGGR